MPQSAQSGSGAGLSLSAALPDNLSDTSGGPATAGAQASPGVQSLAEYEQQDRARPLARIVPWVMLLAMTGFLAFSLVRCTGGEEGRVHVGELTSATSRLEQVEARSSAAYQENLHRYSEERARQALSEHDTFVSPATGVRELPKTTDLPPAPAPVPPKPEPEPQKPETVVLRPRPAPVQPVQDRAEQRELQAQRQRADQELARRREAMMRFLGSLPSQELASAGVYVLNAPQAQEQASVQAPVQAKDEARLAGMKVGDILTAINRVTLDSDAPGPAMVEVVQGPYKGARVIGSFRRLGEHLMLAFSQLVTREGQIIPLEACAIDPETDRTAVRSAVDRHGLSRWGGLVAASFLEGFGDAVSRAGTRSYTSIYGSGLSVPGYSPGDEAWIAAGKVGERAAGVFEKNFTMAPTVTLDSGTLMGVLILQLPGHGQAALTDTRAAPRPVPAATRQNTHSVSGTAGDETRSGPRFVHMQP